MFSGDEFRDLIRRVRAGDESACETLVRQYEPLIRREVKLRLEDQRLRRSFDSQDVCQSVLASFFVRSLTGDYDLQDPAKLLALLVSMTRNKVASAARGQNRLKRDQRRQLSLDAEDGPVALDRGASPSRIVAASELAQLAREALGEEERQMADFRSEGLTWPEIAERMGGTAHARRVQFSRAADRVAQRLGVE